MEVDMDESRYNSERGQKMSGLEGDIQLVEEQAKLERNTEQVREKPSSQGTGNGDSCT